MELDHTGLFPSSRHLYHKTIIKDYSIYVLKTILWANQGGEGGALQPLEKKLMLWLSSCTIQSTFTFQRPSKSNNNESLLLSHHPALMGNWPTCSHMPWPNQSTKWFIISPSQVVRGSWDSVASTEVPLEKKVDMKCIQVNVLKIIARMTRRLYILVMPHSRFRLNIHSVVV